MHITVPSRSLMPFLVSGAISYKEARQLIVKSRRSELLLAGLWVPGRFAGVIRRQRVRVEDVLRSQGALGSSERLRGVLTYTPRDWRRRTYILAQTEKQSIFIKMGVDVVAEDLSEKQRLALLAAGFVAELPFITWVAGDRRVNLYSHLDCWRYHKSRLTGAEAAAFSKALNPGGTREARTLSYVLSTSGSSQDREGIMVLPEVRALLQSAGGHLVALGRVHGDLMSPNLLRRSDGVGPVHVLDWETVSEAAPLLLDLIGSRPWHEVVELADNARRAGWKAWDALPRHEADAVVFMLLSAQRPFAPARSWLSGLKRR